MNNIPIVDAHHHLWDLENEQTKYSWLMVKEGEAFFGDYGAIRKSYLLENYLDDAKNQNLIKNDQHMAAKTSTTSKDHEKYTRRPSRRGTWEPKRPMTNIDPPASVQIFGALGPSKVIILKK